MSLEKTIQTNKYFEYRNVSFLSYIKHSLPLWIKKEICDKNQIILDYGCGLGQNLKALKDNCYENIYGVDIEKEAINFCRANGLNVMEVDLDDLKNPYKFRFDIIILNHVIEHLPQSEIIDFLKLLKKEFLSLNGKGKLLISVPNAQAATGSYWAYEDWTHSTLFTSGSIYYVLKAAGFDTIEFVDIDCTLGISKMKACIRRLLLKLYKMKKSFWNKVTCSSYHKPSPEIFSYEIKIKAS